MYRLPKILLVVACLAGLTLFFQKKQPPVHHQTSFANYPVAISLNGISIDDVEYDSCLRALSYMTQNNFNGFNKSYCNTPSTLTNAVNEMRFKEFVNWLNSGNILTDKKIIRIDSVYGYTDDNGSTIHTSTSGNEKERITYVTFLFPSNQSSIHSTKLLTFEFSDKISTDHFINWWTETI